MLQPETRVDTAEAREQRRREAALRYRRRVVELLDRRKDLEGVSELADVISDGIRWAA
ncbi:MAG TPA: hypothetical protein VFV89_19900 [Nocardioides sp.]|uniref:hypothetical protein n=1 Tax=Nocardioides sp. TaxID=35761 RepID=UPI002E345655|nr:hypothetical protein [Nocardioides sp.]HEX5090082.1 hypothetical protein [Nocardioides sp.]